MSLIISENGKNAERLNPSNFDQENYLQQYIYNNPDAVPIYEIDEDIRLLILAREFQTSSGPIDALGVDQNGNIYLIETKLYKNPDKRKVVAQVLDYGASLWNSSLDFTDFLLQLDSKHVQPKFGVSTTAKLQDFFDINDDDTGLLLESIQKNLNNGIFKFVVLMNDLHKQLKDLIVFLNRNSQFDIYAVELDFYKHKSFEIVIPKLYGAEVKKDIISKSKSSTEPWQKVNQQDFLDNLAERRDKDECSSTTFKTIARLKDIYIEITNQIGGVVNYYYRPNNNDVRMIANDETNKSFLIVDSSCRVEGWPGKRSGPQIDFVNNLEVRMITDGLFGRTEKSKSHWAISLRDNQASDEELAKFLDINEQEFAKLKL